MASVRLMRQEGDTGLDWVVVVVVVLRVVLLVQTTNGRMFGIR